MIGLGGADSVHSQYRPKAVAAELPDDLWQKLRECEVHASRVKPPAVQP
jgi:hypothetical protein